MARGLIVRYKKAIAVALLLLDFTGARVVAVSDACEHNRVFFGPALSFRAIAKTVTHQDWQQPSPRSFGERANHFSGQDMDVVRRESRVASVVILPSINIALGTERSRNRPLYVWKLPSDLHPVQPRHLHSKN
jgi:hypothetical protein